MELRLEPRIQNALRFVPFIVCAIAVVALLASAIRIGRVSASEVGILIDNLSGDIEVRLQPGSFMYNGLTTNLYTIDKTQRTLRMMKADGQEVRIKTKDGSDVTLDIEINYTLYLDENTIRDKVLKESGVEKVRVFTGRARPTGRRNRRGRPAPVPSSLEEAYQAKWIRDYSRAVVRYVFGELTTEEFTKGPIRDSKTVQTKVELNRLLNPHGIEVKDVVPGAFAFYEDYEEKIQQKKEADQELEKQLAQAKTEIQIQERKIVETETDAEVRIARIKGDLEKKVISAQAETVKKKKAAEAYAYTTIINADASFYQAERQAKGMLATATAEAEGMTNLVKALEGEGGMNMVIRAIAERLRGTIIEGLPYATSSLIQKVSVDSAAATAKRGGK